MKTAWQKIKQKISDVFESIMMYFSPPNYFIFTHRRGWIHITKATPQDKKEVSGIMAGYL